MLIPLLMLSILLFVTYSIAYAVPYAVANYFLELSIGVFSCSSVWRLGQKAFSVLFLQISTPFNLIKTLCCMETIHYSVFQIGPGHLHSNAAHMGAPVNRTQRKTARPARLRAHANLLAIQGSVFLSVRLFVRSSSSGDGFGRQDQSVGLFT